MSRFTSDFETLVKHLFPLHFLYELLMSLRRCDTSFSGLSFSMIYVFCDMRGGWDVVSKGLTSYYIHKWIQPARNIRFPRLPTSSLTAPGGTGVREGKVIGTRAPQRAFSQAKDSLIFLDKNNESHKREIASFNYSCNFCFYPGCSRQVQNLRDELYQSKLRLEKETSSLKEANKVRFEWTRELLLLFKSFTLVVQ